MAAASQEQAIPALRPHPARGCPPSDPAPSGISDHWMRRAGPGRYWWPWDHIPRRCSFCPTPLSFVLINATSLFLLHVPGSLPTSPHLIKLPLPTGWSNSSCRTQPSCKPPAQLICTRKERRRRRWHPTPVLLPGKSCGWRSLVGLGLESDMTEAT